MLSHKNITLRKITYDDTKLIVNWRNTETVRKYLFTQTELTKDEHIWWMKNKVDTGECVQFIIEIKDLSKAIGTVFIKNIDINNSKGEYGIFIGESIARGLGYGTIAAQLALKYAFENLKLNRVYLSVLKDNIYGIRSYENAGFQIEGVLRQDIKRNDEYCDVVLMSILKKAWKGIIE